MDGVYSICDTVAGIYLPPFTFKNDNEARRMFGNCVNSADHVFNKNPGDYILYKIGFWDVKTGEITALKDGKQQDLGSASDYKIIPTTPLLDEMEVTP